MKHLEKLASPCLKLSNIAIFVTAFICMSFVGCGQTVPEKDYEFEREKRVETEQFLSQAQDDASQLKYFLTSIQATPHYVWIYHAKIFTHDETKSAYNEALETCQELGFELPTNEIAAEAASNPELKKIMYAESGRKNFVTVDQPTGTTTLIVLCAKKI